MTNQEALTLRHGALALLRAVTGIGWFGIPAGLMLVAGAVLAVQETARRCEPHGQKEGWRYDTD